MVDFYLPFTAKVDKIVTYYNWDWKTLIIMCLVMQLENKMQFWFVMQAGLKYFSAFLNILFYKFLKGVVIHHISLLKELSKANTFCISECTIYEAEWICVLLIVSATTSSCNLFSSSSKVFRSNNHKCKYQCQQNKNGKIVNHFVALGRNWFSLVIKKEFNYLIKLFLHFSDGILFHH